VLAAGEDQERLIEALLTLARGQRGLDHREPVDLHALAAAVLRDHGHPSVRLDHTLEPASTCGDARLVTRLITNLVDNALRHNVSGGWAAVRTGTRDGRPTLLVTNTGPVIPPDRVEALFQPFQRLHTRTGTSDGFGLGLSIVAAIAAAHDAHLTAEPRVDGGLTITIAFNSC
jgi:signal transduction histidine kinase